MSTLKATTVEPATGTNVTLGTSGDTVALPGNTLALDTWKDSGGNTLFTSDGSGTVSNVNAGLAGAGPVLIQSQTASGVATVDFTSGIDSTYDKYMFVLIDVAPATDSTEFSFQVNGVGESGFNETITSTVFRAYHPESGSGANLAYDTSRDQAQGTAYQKLSGEVGSGADESLVGILYLYSPASTTYVKHFIWRGTVYFSENAVYANHNAGYINTTTAIDEVSFKFASGNIANAKIKLYGVK